MWPELVSVMEKIGVCVGDGSRGGVGAFTLGGQGYSPDKVACEPSWEVRAQVCGHGRARQTQEWHDGRLGSEQGESNRCDSRRPGARLRAAQGPIARDFGFSLVLFIHPVKP